MTADEYSVDDGVAGTELPPVQRLQLVGAVVSFVAGAALLVARSMALSVLGLLLSAVVPAVLLGLHNQVAQRRATLLGIYPGRGFLVGRALLLLAATAAAGWHGYNFAVALEDWVLS